MGIYTKDMHVYKNLCMCVTVGVFDISKIACAWLRIVPMNECASDTQWIANATCRKAFYWLKFNTSCIIFY